ncbi:MAG: HesA/MoeB/ThiF family protein [Candidatus Aenigmarchaeota archaeon]|nr:HesA/MoeB/ThiF family protein [Candidatus Aenigmarchaeota archaeon]
MRSRQEVFIGREKQEILEKSTVAVVGLGGTGHAAAEYLARAGVSLILADNDVVERCNMGRQSYGADDVGRLKVVVMEERLSPLTSVESHAVMLSDINIDKILSKADIVLDGSDNFGARFLVNDWCVKRGKPFTYTGAIRAEVSFCFWLPGRPCLRCVFSGKTADDSCEKDGILSPVAAFAGTLSAIEALKHLIGEKPVEGLVSFDFFESRFEVLKAKGREGCACSGQGML